MKYKVTKTLQGKVVIDESDIEVHDFITDIYRIWEWLDDSSLLGRHKVLATINFSINKDVPMVAVEDEVEKLAEIAVPKAMSEYGKSDGTRETTIDYNKGFRNQWIDGYKKAQEGGVYSEADLRKALLIKHDGLSVDYVIQSLKQEYIELEMEHSNRIYYDGTQGIKTNTVDNQLMAYVKKI